jgi:translocation and assembly module TamB
MSAEIRRPSLPVRILRFLVFGLCALVGLVILTVGGVLLYVDSPSGRRLAVTKLNEALAASFQGRIQVQGAQDLGIFGVSGVNATVFDPSGRPALIVRGVHVRIAPWAVARSALFGKAAPITIGLFDVSIDDIDVRLDTDASGQLDLVSAFAPKTPQPNAPSNQPGRGVRLDLPRIVLKHVWAHGTIGGVAPIDADVDSFDGSFSYAPDMLQGAITKATIKARRIANGADVVGLLTAHVEDPTGPLSGLKGSVSWRGLAGTLAHSLEASLERNRVTAVVEAPSFDAASVRLLAPGVALESSGSLHVEAQGTLPNIDLQLRASLGEATLTGKGNIVAADDKQATFSLVAHDLDIHQFSAGAPRSRLGMTAALSGSQSANGGVELRASVHFLGGTVGSQTLPAAEIRGDAAGPSTKEVHARADIVIEEPSAPTRVTLTLTPKRESYVVEATLDSNIDDFDRVPELKHSIAGTAHLAARGTLDLGAMTLDAHLNANVANVVQGPTRLANASASVHAWGPLAKMSFDVGVHGRELAAGGRHVTSFDIAAAGPEGAPRVTLHALGPDIPMTEASTTLDLGHGVVLRGLDLSLTRASERATANVDSIRVDEDGLRVEGARIEGLGWPATMSFEQSGKFLHLRALSQGIDLGRIGRIGCIEDTLGGGTLSLDTDIHLAPGRASGKASFDLADASLAGVSDISAHVELAIDGRQMKGEAKARARDIGSFDLGTPKLDLGEGSVLSLATWRQAWGDLSFGVHCNLKEVFNLIPPDKKPFGEAQGELSLDGHIGRTNRTDLTPDVKLTFKTVGLALAPNTPRSRDIDGVMVVGPPAWHLQNVDFAGALAINGNTGLIDLETRVQDGKGALADVHVKLPHFPYADAFYDAARFPDDVRASPFDIDVSIPERGLGGLPEFLKQDAVTGKIKADIHASGTMLVPHVDVTATLHDPHFSGETQSLAMDIALDAHYDGKMGAASIKAGSGDNVALDAHATFDAEFGQFLDPGESLEWSASAKAHFADFPLAAIPALDQKLISGKLRGDIELIDLHKKAHALADITVDGLRVGTVDYKSARIQAKADGRALDGAMHIEQTDGFVDTKARAVATWGSAMAPVLDPKQPVEVQLNSKNFRVAALLPLLSQSLDELDGRLDAGVQVSLEPSTGGAKMSGTVSLSRGLIEASAGGGELHDVAASVRFNPDGTIIVDRLSASGLTGRLEGSASARFDGTRFQSARAIILIPKRSAIPVTANGAEMGNVDGRIEVTANASPDGRATTLAVQIPRLHVALPEGTSSDVQALGAMDNVHIGAHKGSKTSLLLVPLDPKKHVVSDSPSSRIAIAVNIGDVEVQRGTDLKVDLNGNLHVESGAKTQVTGQIHLDGGGVLNVQGKNFEVEGGTVTFSGGDPSNPEIVVKANWTAPDATVVSANFVGPLKTGKVTLTSQPTLPKQEIVELLLYGTTTGQQAQSPSSNTNSTAATENTAIATAGGEAAQPLNHALNQLGLGAVTAKVDTSDVNPKPEIEVQIAKGLSLQLAYVLGIPPPGVNPDTTLVSLDWRFLSKWSIQTTVGNAGTTIFDLLWQSRY